MVPSGELRQNEQCKTEQARPQKAQAIPQKSQKLTRQRLASQLKPLGGATASLSSITRVTLMRSITRHTGTLKVVKREKSSRNGNPRWCCFLITDSVGNGLSFVTAPDSSHGYRIINLDGKRVEVEIGQHYNRETLNSVKEL